MTAQSEVMEPNDRSHVMVNQRRSILKGSRAAGTNPNEPSSKSHSAETSDSHRKLHEAVRQAEKLQRRKDGEAAIFEAVCELLDFPNSASASAGNPCEADMQRFRTLIEPFTPLDFDDLVRERNISKKCGYVLCAIELTARQQRLLGEYARRSEKIGWEASRQVANQDPLVPLHTPSRMAGQMWCSEGCERRATFVKVQLSPRPSWERNHRGATNGELGSGSSGTQILQAEDEAALLEKTKEMSLEKLAPTEEDRIEEAMRELALERGEYENSSSGKIASVTTSDVVERMVGHNQACP